MSNLIEHRKEGRSNSSLWEIVQDHALDIVKFVAIGLAIYVIARLIAIPFGYGFFIDHLSSDFGLEETYARPFAIALTALAVAATPTLLLAILFGYRAQVTFVAILGVSVIFAVATYFFTDDVYFDRVTGKAQKCYAKTLEGFKFSSTCDFDPKLGVRFQKIDSDVMKEIVFWQRNGALKDIPSVNDGQYFDPLTGESIVWYSLHSNGSIRLFSLPGFDPATGKRLKPITKKVIDEYELDAEMSTAIVNTYRSGSLLSDIELALADGYGEYGSTETSRRALENIWEWYSAQNDLPKVVSSQERIYSGNFPFTKVSDAQVENVIDIKPYTLIIVSFSSDNSYSGGVDIYSVIHDKDAHNVSFKSRPELNGIYENKGNPFTYEDKDHIVYLNLNPHETKKVMYFIKGAKRGQMNEGYVRFLGDGEIKYSLTN